MLSPGWTAAERTVSVAPTVNREADLGSARELPLITYSRHYGQPCYADYVPTQNEIAEQFSAAVAGNEFEPVQIGLFVPSGSTPLKKVKVDVDIDLPHRIGYLHYESYGAHWRPIDGDKWYTDYPGGRRSMPLYLVPGSTVETIEPGHSAAFWITFQCAADCQSGIHRGHFTISSPGMAPQRHELELVVHPFSLPRANIAFSLYYRPDRIPRYWTREYQQKYAVDMAEHGLNTGQITSFYSTFGSDEFLANGRVPTPATSGSWIEPWYSLLDAEEYADGQVDPERLVGAQIDMFRQAGLSHPDIPLFSVQDNWRCQRKSVIADTFRRLATEQHWPEVLLQTRDEPPPWLSGPGSLDQDDVRAMLEFKRLMNCRTFSAFSGPSVLTYGNLHDVWIVLAGQITPELVREAERQGAELWSYSERLRITNLRANRYYSGLYSWGLDLRGNTAYSYSHYVFQPKAGEGAVDPAWLPAHGRASLGMVNGFALPGPEGPIPGLGLEGRREGIDDYRYIQLLETRLSAADATSTVAARAAQWLNELKQTLRAEAITGVFASGYQHLWELDWVEPSVHLAPNDYTEIRDTAAEYIKHLTAVPGELNPPTESEQYPESGWEGEAFAGRPIASVVAAISQGTRSEQRAAITSLLYTPPGEENVPSVINSLVAALDEPELKLPALRAITALGSQASAATGRVSKQLGAEDPIVRCAALLALQSIGPDAVDALADGLSDPFLMNAGFAAECLSRMGPNAASALPDLESAANSSNEALRKSILSSIHDIRHASH